MLRKISSIRRSKEYNVNIRYYFYKRDIDHYKVLGLDSKKEYSDEDIKKAYFHQAQQHHPDISRNKDASSRFQLVGRAYDELKTKDKRYQLAETSTTSGFDDEWKNHEEFKNENKNGSNSYGYFIFERLIHPKYLIGFLLPFGIIVYCISSSFSNMSNFSKNQVNNNNHNNNHNNTTVLAWYNESNKRWETPTPWSVEYKKYILNNELIHVNRNLVHFSRKD